LGQATWQEAWGEENRRGRSTAKTGIWKTNWEGIVRMKSEAEAESAALQGRNKGKAAHHFVPIFKLVGDSCSVG